MKEYASTFTLPDITTVDGDKCELTHCSQKRGQRWRLKSDGPTLWVNKLQVIVLCNEGSRAYCANALRFNDLIREPHSNWSRKFRHRRERDARQRHRSTRSCVNCYSSRQMCLRFLPIPCFIKISWTPQNAKCCLAKLNDLLPLSSMMSF